MSNLVLRVSIAAAILAQGLCAATFTVTNTNDTGAGSLRDAVAQAEANAVSDTIIFDAALAGQTINLTTAGDTTWRNTALSIAASQGLTIDGSAAPGLVIDANNMRILRVTPTGVLTLQDITLSGGTAAGGNANGSGGGSGGGGAGMGGAIFNEGSLTLLRVTLTNHVAQGGNGGLPGAGMTSGSAGGGPNGGSGGPFGNPNGTSGSAATGIGGGGGGGGSGFGGTSGNGGAGGFGGGGGGGGGANGSSSVIGTGGAGGFGASSGANGATGTPGFGGAGGRGAGLGGAIFNSSGTLICRNCTFSGNTASPGTTGNGAANGLGGGIFNRNGNVTLQNCTFTLNTATDGGAMYNCGDGAGAVATATIGNTIMANSTATNDFVGFARGGGTNTTSGLGNLFMTSTGFAGTIVSTTNPNLGALAGNGGPTQTHAIITGSSAANAGNNAAAGGLTVDQRGLTRIVNTTVDIGSFEIQNQPEMDVTRGGAVSDGGTDTVTSAAATVASVLTYTITNSGLATLNITLPVAAPGGPPNNCTANISTQPSATVGPSLTTTIVISVTPLASGPFSCTISIVNDDFNENPYNWTISGTSAPPPAPEMDVTRGGAVSDNGTDTVTGAAAATASVLTYTITNSGNATLNITLPVAAPGTQTNCTASITTQPSATVASGGGTTTLVVSLTPASGGGFSCTISITNDDSSENPYNWTISGTATGPQPEMDVTRGATPVGDGTSDVIGSVPFGSPQTVTYTINNAGTAGLNLTGMPDLVTVVAGTLVSSATVTTQPSSSVAPAASVNFVVTYTVSGAGAFNFTVNIPNNDPDEAPYNWTVSGTGITAPEIEIVRGTAVPDGGTDTITGAVSSTALVLTYTVNNTGNVTLNLTLPISVTGQTNCTASVTTPPSVTVGAGLNTTFVVTVTPAAAGSFSFNVSVVSDDADESPYDFTASGTASTAGGGGGGGGGDDKKCSTQEDSSLWLLLALPLALYAARRRTRA